MLAKLPISVKHHDQPVDSTGPGAGASEAAAPYLIAGWEATALISDTGAGLGMTS